MWVVSMEYPNCDLCGSDKAQILYNNANWQSLEVDLFRLVRCSRCGLIYLCPRPDKNEIPKYYQGMYSCYKNSVESEKNNLVRWARRRNLINRCRQVERASQIKAGKILDVGCATGLFLNQMRLNGWEAYGVEPVETAASYAREEFGLEIFNGFFEEAPYPEGSFDVITFWDVLEHTFSPQKELLRTARLLKPGGSVIINIPNWNSFDRVLFDAFWIGLDPPRHFYVFDSGTAGQMLEKAGLQVQEWVCLVPSYYAFSISLIRWLEAKHPGLANPLMKVLNFPGMRFMASPFFWITDLLHKSSLISVIARKPISD
jgi:SAM-dependent methyltransferase